MRLSNKQIDALVAFAEEEIDKKIQDIMEGPESLTHLDPKDVKELQKLATEYETHEKEIYVREAKKDFLENTALQIRQKYGKENIIYGSKRWPKEIFRELKESNPDVEKLKTLKNNLNKHIVLKATFEKVSDVQEFIKKLIDEHA